MNKSFNLKRAFSIARKEQFHILRDPFTLTMAAVIPVIIVLIFGLAIEFNVKDIKITVHDSDRTASSRQIVDTFTSSNYFLVSPTHSSISNSIKDLNGYYTEAIDILLDKLK